MQIEFVDFVAGARNAQGLVVVIDVFRAFTTACYCLDAGAEKIIAVGDSEQALNYRYQLNQCVLLGERFGRKLPGFDFGNSPSEIAGQSLQGKTVIHTTHAGTQGLVNAVGADEVLTGAFVNARATANYILAREPERVTLVRMGLNADTRSDEDWFYADYLAAILNGDAVDDATVYQKLKASPFSARFFDETQPWSPAADFECCLAFNTFDFVLKARRLDDQACELLRV
ncbi:2-phosphosulfolactate phosphatase [Teredinibacter haidensis]|uniref:2-phosphosulfolactate phosphatase n=1 Tax=Teredinibacter haidensis TaxID=2731755 RepID=UPI000948D79E|nr:2-phosphosulfolactate phosphatase [Teredinibacter haidensis]